MLDVEVDDVLDEVLEEDDTVDEVLKPSVNIATTLGSVNQLGETMQNSSELCGYPGSNDATGFTSVSS